MPLAYFKKPLTFAAKLNSNIKTKKGSLSDKILHCSKNLKFLFLIILFTPMNKHRFSVLIVIIISAFHTLSAQTSYQAGLTVGTNYSSLRSDLFTTASGRLGLTAGCSFTLGIGKRFELNPEFVFIQKGASAKAVRFMPEEKVENFAYDYHYNTFEAGLFAGFQPVEDIPVRLQAGGFFGTHFSNLSNEVSDLWVGDYNQVNNAIPAEDLNNAFSGLDFGPAAGISAGSGRLRLNARYYFGMKNLYNNIDFVEDGHRISTGSLRVSLTCFLK